MFYKINTYKSKSIRKQNNTLTWHIISVNEPCAAGKVVVRAGVKLVFGVTVGKLTVGAGGRMCLGGVAHIL